MLVKLNALRPEKEGGLRSEVDQAVFDLKSELKKSMEEDLSLQGFWPVLFRLTRTVHKLVDQSGMSAEEQKVLINALKEMDKVLCILDWGNVPFVFSRLSSEIREMIARREEARQKKDFSRADDIRDKLLERGFRLVDSPQGVQVFKADKAEKS
jgi:cysteinyl-tRNA synthetase